MEHEGRELAQTAEGPRSCERVALVIGPEQLSSFFPALQRGVVVQAKVGCPLKELLCAQFGIPEEYVVGRITTIFLDNHPVDDLDRSLIHEGSRVTLSAAMPGLVGAMMRRSGFLATLRQGISHAEQGSELKHDQGTVRLKLFNLLLSELGPLILARGIFLPKNELDGLLCALGPASRIAEAAPELGQSDPGAEVLLRVTIRDSLRVTIRE